MRLKEPEGVHLAPIRLSGCYSGTAPESVLTRRVGLRAHTAEATKDA
jgi:hypothetical protein